MTNIIISDEVKRRLLKGTATDIIINGALHFNRLCITDKKVLFILNGIEVASLKIPYFNRKEATLTLDFQSELPISFGY